MNRALTPRELPRVRELDWLMGAVVCLCCLGLVMAVSIRGFDPEVGPLLAMKGQGRKLLVGLCAFLAAAAVPLPTLRRWAGPALVVATILCVATLFFRDAKGASRWIKLGSYSFQPVELARFILVVHTADRAARAGFDFTRFRTGLLAIMTPAALIAGILLLQPDVGNAIFTLSLIAVMALAAGVPMRHFILLGAPLAAAVALAVSTRQHVRDRLTNYLDVEAGSQVWQSLVAIASGGPLGRGLGEGWMKMGYVPEASNDFVFAIIGEELGLLGALLVLALYTAIGVVGLRLVLRIEDPFCRILVFGFTFALCTQAAINLLVTTGLAPAKGIDLPFVSSGGTNLLFSLAAIGIIGNAARNGQAALIPGRD